MGTVIGVLALAVGVLALVAAHSGGSGTSSPPSTPSAAILSAVTTVDPAVVETVGSGGVQDKLTRLSPSTAALTQDGKPEVLYVGADYCPYCAAERWALVVALSRFGTFGNLHLITSASDDVYPDTHTFSFYGSTYASPYAAFTAVEETDRDHNAQQSPTTQQQQLLDTYDAAPYVDPSLAGGIPFVDIGGRSITVSSGYDPGVLQNLDWQQIASSLSNPTSPVTKAIVGTADYLTAAICQATNGQPAAVCSSPAITALANHLAQQAPVG